MPRWASYGRGACILAETHTRATSLMSFPSCGARAPRPTKKPGFQIRSSQDTVRYQTEAKNHVYAVLAPRRTGGKQTRTLAGSVDSTLHAILRSEPNA